MNSGYAEIVKNDYGSIFKEITQKFVIRHQNLVVIKVGIQKSSEFNEICLQSRTGHNWSISGAKKNIKECLNRQPPCPNLYKSTECAEIWVKWPVNVTEWVKP